MKNTIVVTGSCGFIGSNMCNYLLNKDYYVIGVDNMLTGKIENLDNFKHNPKFDFIEFDICKTLKINSKINGILHFASTASPKDYLKYPIKTLQIGSIGTENILKLALKNQCKVLVASTSEIYGDPLEHPQKETYYGNVNPVGPRGVYDEAKRYLEAITIAYHKKKKIDSKIVRIFNTYGPKMRKDDGRAIPNFINQMINNNDITVFGDGKQTRSFCYIDDTIDGIYRTFNNNYNFPINIGNPVEHSIIELIEYLRRLIPSSSKIKYFNLPENDPKMRKPDISLAKKLFNWSPSTKIENGLVKTIDYFCNLK